MQPDGGEALAKSCVRQVQQLVIVRVVRFIQDHVRLYSTHIEPASQPEAVAAGFEGKRNPRDRVAGPDRLIPPAMQQGKQPFRARLQLLVRLTLNTGKHAGNEPARLAHGWGIAALHR